jgi:hypothetical protein
MVAEDTTTSPGVMRREEDAESSDLQGRGTVMQGPSG